MCGEEVLRLSDDGTVNVRSIGNVVALFQPAGNR
jgi:hypothetical protein